MLINIYIVSIVLQASECPPTQLNVSLRPPCFVDMESVYPASQAAETQKDPLNQSGLSVPVKEEPIQFLNMMRFSINSNNSSENFDCELIPSEEQVINLDTEEEKQATEDLACFDIMDSIIDNAPPSACPASSAPTEEDTYKNILAGVHRLDDEVETPPNNMWVPAENQLPSAQTEETIDTNVKPALAVPDKPVANKKQMPATKSQARKRPRLMADNVPQLRHEFRPLPLAAVVRIEPYAVQMMQNVQNQEEAAISNQEEQLQNQPESRNAVTASQALATDNTLMESSELQHLLDAQFVNQRKVNVVDQVSDSNNNDRAARHERIVYRSLERYLSFSSLTTAQISRYHINSLSVGSPYQQALICVNGRHCNVYGPLLHALFSHCTASLRADLDYLLRDVDEFIYNCRQQLRPNSTEDLRTRVLCTFMRVATPFAYFRLEFENETREWAVCRVICKRERDKIKPKCDVQTAIRPEILERMKKLKFLLLHPNI